jgi:hypothetical protein
MAAVAERSHADIYPMRRWLRPGFRDNAFKLELVNPINRRTTHAPLRRLTAILAADVAGYSSVCCAT